MRRLPLSLVSKKAAGSFLHRIASDLGGPVRSLKMRSPSVSVLESIPFRNFRGDAANGENILSGHFIYADQHLDVGRQGDPWPLPAPSERFAYWLHSFNWLWDLTIRGEKDAGIKARQLADQWISTYGKWNSYSWDNDVLVNRLYAWICNWSAIFSADRLSDNGQIRRSSLYRQVDRLKSKYNQTSEGIPKFKAATVIAMAGLLRPDKAYDYLNRGLDLLDEQIHVQILPDGGHISRNPQDCVEALEILTALDQALERRGVEGSSSINPTDSSARYGNFNRYWQNNTLPF